MVFMRKKLIAIISLVLLIAIAFVLNYGYTSKKEEAAKNEYSQNLDSIQTSTSSAKETSTEKDKLFTGIFTTYREEREINRSRSIDALKEINEGISGLSRESAQTALPRKQKELVQAFYIDLVDLEELYRHLSHDLTRADLTKRSIEELEEVHLINQHIINIAQQLQ